MAVADIESPVEKGRLDGLRRTFGSVKSAIQGTFIPESDRNLEETARLFLVDIISQSIRGRLLAALSRGITVDNQVLVGLGQRRDIAEVLVRGVIDENGELDQDGPVLFELSDSREIHPKSYEGNFAVAAVFPNPERTGPFLGITFDDGQGKTAPIDDPMVLHKMDRYLEKYQYAAPLDPKDAAFFFDVYPDVGQVETLALLKARGLLLATLLGVELRKRKRWEEFSETLFNDSSLVPEPRIAEGIWNEDYVQIPEGDWNG